MADKGPIDKKAAVFAICAAVFLGGLGYVLSHRMITYSATPDVSGSGPSAPDSRPPDTPADTPQKK